MEPRPPNACTTDPELSVRVSGACTSRRPLESRALRVYLWVFALATFCLVMLGGTVTSKGAGLAVPDWPTTFDQNMFLFHPRDWVGNIFWEHSHRLLGSLVGVLSIGAATWLALTRDAHRRRWARFAFITLLLIIVQGIMGGLRVTELSIPLAVMHGITGQVILSATVLLAASAQLPAQPAQAPTGPDLRWPTLLLALAILIQLTLGSAMRHTNSGLAIPDFPAMYGGLLPPLEQQAIDRAMSGYALTHERFEFANHGFKPWQVGVHLAHRLGAAAVSIVAVWALARVLRSGVSALRGPAWVLAATIPMQALLGASVIWTHRHPEVATGHQSLGALILAASVVLAARAVAAKPRRVPSMSPQLAQAQRLPAPAAVGGAA